MPTSYERIYENVLPKFQSYDIPIMTVDEVKDLLHDYLIPAIARFHVCRKNLNNRNDKLERFNEELSIEEIDILSNYAVLEYIDSNCIRVPSVLKASLSSVDFNAFSPANFLNSLMAMHTRFLAENETLISRYAWGGFSNGEISESWNTGYKKRKSFC